MKHRTSEVRPSGGGEEEETPAKVRLNRVKQERPDSPAPSCVSLKSDWSMPQPLKFKGGQFSVGRRDQQERPDSPAPSCVSLKSDRSTPCTEDEPQATCQQKLKSRLKKKFECLFEGTAKQGNPALLNDIYTELYITEGGSGGINEEHEVRHIERKHKLAVQETTIKCRDIFTASPGKGSRIRTALTLGVAGIGKTVSVHKFVLDWAEGKANKDLHFIFALPFRDLNLMKGKDYSLIDLILHFVPEMKEFGSAELERCKTLFILDGLDESRLPLDFRNNESCSDVTKTTCLDVLLTNLIKGNLLPSALIWITSRPAAAGRIPPERVHRVTEIRGFGDPQKEEYFRKRFGDEDLANRVITHVKSTRSLYIMCHIPVFCWISASVLEKLFGDEDCGEIPKTLTQMYTHFIIFQTSLKNEKYLKKEATDPLKCLQLDKEFLVKLGKLAFRNLETGNLIFYEEDLKEFGIDVSEASVYSGVCTEILKQEVGLYEGKVYCFVHLTVQEYLAAFHTFLSHNDTKWLKKTVDQALQSKNGHLHLYLRFLLGLSVDSNQSLLQGLLTESERRSYDTKQIVEYINKKIKKNLSPERIIYLFHCLIELNDDSQVKEVQNYLNTGCLSENQIKSTEWSALAFVLLMSAEELDVLDLRNCTLDDEGLQRMVPVVRVSRTALLSRCRLTDRCCEDLASTLSSECNLEVLNLSANDLQDSGVKKLSAGLRSEHCKLHTLSLTRCGLRKRCCKVLASVLTSTSSHLRELHLSDNDLQDSGVKKLSARLRSEHCTLDTLSLSHCGLTENCCEDLASVLTSTSSHLRELHLSDNDLQDSGVKKLSSGLRSEHRTLGTLSLSRCGLTENCCEVLASVLTSTSSHLRELHLSDNDLQDSGVKKLSAGLRSEHCTLDTLSLNLCGLTENCCEVLASVLTSTSSHLRELDLSDNDLQDSGVKKLSAGLRSEHCTLDTLRLSGCCVTEEGCASLASALGSNPLHLRELNLSYNHPGASGVKLLSGLLEDPQCKLETLHVDHGGQCRISPGLRKYSCQLTLDPNTAHRYLNLSEDNRKATCKEKSFSSFTLKFERFPEVLCVESLTGRCYWEVQWGGSGAEIGVTYKGIERKEDSDHSWFGYNDKSWCLSCFDEKYTASHNKIHTIIPGPPCDRVGVYLDWAAGTLSFYSVSSGELTLLHRFTSTFTEPLYPAFVIRRWSSVSLCDLG